VVPRDSMMIHAVAVGFQVLADIGASESRVFVRTDVGVVRTCSVFDIIENRIEVVGIGCEPGRILGRKCFTAERTHIISGPTEDDHLWDCFLENGFRFGCSANGWAGYATPLSFCERFVGIAHAIPLSFCERLGGLRHALP
jgi:hypothetical protein